MALLGRLAYNFGLVSHATPAVAKIKANVRR